MRTLKLEDGVFNTIMGMVARTGKSPSSVLQDVLRSHELCHQDSNGSTHEKSSRLTEDTDSAELASFVNTMKVSSHNTVVKRMLEILSFVYHQKGEEAFNRVETYVTGRSRKYFGRSEKELSKTGTSVNPKRIPGSPFWVITNNATDRKVELLKEVLELLEYENAAIQRALSALQG
jgi:negative modulator of initiation of replication